MVEKNAQSAGARCLTIEGEVGKPPDLKPFATLWKGTESLDTTLGILDSYFGVQLIEELGCVKDLEKASARDAMMSKAALESIKSSVDMNSMQTLATTVSSLETKVLDLRE